MLLTEKNKFHAKLALSTFMLDSNNIPTNADKDSKVSVAIATELSKLIPCGRTVNRPSGQTLGNLLEKECLIFIQNTFPNLAHLRPGSWSIQPSGNITNFEQYEHLNQIEQILLSNPQLRSSLGGDYIIKPDIVIARNPESDSVINAGSVKVIATSAINDVAKHAVIRSANQKSPILHASISCKWTIRSDRAQNSRSEALNLIRNRKGHLPHVIVVTAEPLPSRLASLCYGTGDIDCVYHFALYELMEAVKATGYADSLSILDDLVQGKRIKDITDLPLDLAV